MEDSKTISLWQERMINPPADQLEIYEPDDDGDICICVWRKDRLVMDIWGSQSTMRRVARAILEVAD